MHNDGEYFIPFKTRLLDDPTTTKIIEYLSFRSPASGIIEGLCPSFEAEVGESAGVERGYCCICADSSIMMVSNFIIGFWA